MTRDDAFLFEITLAIWVGGLYGCIAPRRSRPKSFVALEWAFWWVFWFWMGTMVPR